MTSLVVRGPNLPASVEGPLEGHLTISLKDFIVSDLSQELTTGRFAIWGMHHYDYPKFLIQNTKLDITLICPVTEPFEEFQKYLTEKEILRIEFCRKIYVISSIEVDVRKVPTPSKATYRAVEIPGMRRKGSIGSCTVSIWFEPLLKTYDVSLTQLKTQRMQHNLNKRRLVLTKNFVGQLRTVQDIFNNLEATMSKQKIRLIDMYQFCNQLKTPVADLSPLLDQYVEEEIPKVLETQFWLMISNSGGRLFAFADFQQRFKIAQRAFILFKTQRGNTFTALKPIKSILEDPTSSKRVRLGPGSLFDNLKSLFPNISSLDIRCVLAFLFISYPEKLHWNYKDICAVMKQEPDSGEDSPEEVDQLSESVEDPAPNSSLSAQQTNTESVEVVQKTVPEKETPRTEPQEQNSPTEEDLPSQEVVLKELLNTMIPSRTQTNLEKKRIQRSDSGIKHLNGGLHSLILSCQRTLADVSIGRQENLVSIGSPVLQKPLGRRPLLSRRRMVGMSDDPVTLTEDVYFTTLLQKASYNPSLLCLPTETNCSLAKESHGPVVSPGWLKLVFHEVQTGSVVVRKMVVRVVDYKTEFIPTERSVLWIPRKILNKKIYVVIEVHAVDPVDHFQRSGVFGFVKLETESRLGDCCLISGMFPVRSLWDGKQKGQIFLSLYQSKDREETTPLPCKNSPVCMSPLPKENLQKKLVEAQTQTQDKKALPSEQVPESGSKESLDKDERRLFSEVDGEKEEVSSPYLKIIVYCVKWQEPVNKCCVSCGLEKDPGSIKVSELQQSSVESPSTVVFDFTHCLTVPNNAQDWFSQSLVFKVMDSTEQIIGELQLDLYSLPEFQRICGPMGVLDKNYVKRGDIKVDVQLLSTDSQIPLECTETRKGDLNVAGKLKKESLLTCSDDEDYCVIGGIEDPNYHTFDEIDDLCSIFTKQADVKDYKERTVTSPEVGVFHCEDDFVLDFTKTEDYLRDSIPETKELMENLEVEDVEEIPVVRVSSDQLAKEKSWEFSSVLPPVNQSKEQDAKTAETETSESLNIDALLEKYSLKRKPGWWKSLISDSPEHKQQVENAESNSDQESSGSF